MAFAAPLTGFAGCRIGMHTSSRACLAFSVTGIRVGVTLFCIVTLLAIGHFKISSLNNEY